MKRQASALPDKEVTTTPDDFVGWHHYFPPGYPITDDFHNPWLPVDPISGKTAFQIWNDDRSISAEDFRRKLVQLVQRETEPRSEYVGNSPIDNAFSGAEYASARDGFTGLLCPQSETSGGSLDREEMKFSKMRMNIAAKCKQCDRVIASTDNAHRTSSVFTEARNHAAEHKHEVTIRQAEWLTIEP